MDIARKVVSLKTYMLITHCTFEYKNAIVEVPVLREVTQPRGLVSFVERMKYWKSRINKYKSPYADVFVLRNDFACKDSPCPPALGSSSHEIVQ